MNYIYKLYCKLYHKFDVINYWRMRGMKVGEGCDIHSTAQFESEPYLISLGNNVRVNKGVHFVTHDGGVWVLRNRDKEYKNIDLFNPIKIGNNVHIGTNSIIMPGVTIGDNVIIGCGAIVTKDIADNSIAVGVPARVIESIDDYAEKHNNDFDYTKNLNNKQKREYLIDKFIN